MMSASFDPLSGKPITLIPHAAPAKTDPVVPVVVERAEVPYEIHPVFVQSEAIPIPVEVVDPEDDQEMVYRDR